MQPKHRIELFGAAQLELTQAAPLLDSTKRLLDPASDVDRLGVALVARGAAINGGATGSVAVLGHVRRDADPRQFGDHALGVVVHVGTQSFLVGPGNSVPIALVASRSPVPTACVTLQSTIKAWRLSMST